MCTKYYISILVTHLLNSKKHLSHGSIHKYWQNNAEPLFFIDNHLKNHNLAEKYSSAHLINIRSFAYVYIHICVKFESAIADEILGEFFEYLKMFEVWNC